MGIITNTPGRSFSNVAGQLIKPKAWHNLEGSVARWDNSKVLMAQTAMAVPGFVADTPKEIAIGDFKLPEINWPKFDLPKFDKEAFEFGEIDMSTVSAKFEELKSSGAALLSGAKKEKIIAPKVKPEISAVPKLRGPSKLVYNSKGTPIAIKLKDWAINKFAELETSWNKGEMSKSVKTMQSKATPIGDMVKDKFGLDPSVNSNALATMIISLLAILFLLLGLAKPSRKR